MRWSDEITLKFVKLYLNYECLWNPAHSNYKFKYEREKAYDKLSQEFEAATKKCLTKTDVKNKIRNLRTTYNQQVHKIYTKSNPDKIYEPSLKWFEEMDRCLKNISGTRLVNSNGNSENVSPRREWNEKDNSSNDGFHPDPLITNSDEYNIEPHSATTEDHFVKLETKSPVNQHHKRDKKKKNKRKVSNCTESSIECLNKEDEFDIYGKHVASQLRNMNLHTALKLQLDIQNLISDARIADLNND